MKKQIYLKYWILFIFTLAKMAILPFFLPSGGITSDSIDYFKIAEKLPKLNTDLFPVGYPLLLQFFYLFTEDYFYSSRIISTLAILLIGVFSYYKKFYFKETIIFLTFRIFSLYLFSYSETPFLTLEYFLIYFLHEYLTGKIKGWKFIIPAAVIMSLMVLMRYSGLYIYIAIGLFFLYYTFRRKYITSIFQKSYFYFLLFSAIGILSYMFFNYMNFGDFSGEKSRGGPIYNNFWGFTYANFLGLINIVNPVISTKVSGTNLITQIIGAIIILIDLLFLFIFSRCYIKYFKKSINNFHQLLLVIGGVYLIFMIISEYTQNIEELTSRMLCEATFALLFSFLILFFKHFPEKGKWVFYLGIISLTYSILTIVKIPSYYLENRCKVEAAIEGRDIKYFYDDSRKGPEKTIIKIPILNKEIEYMNYNVYSGYYNRYILNTIYPSVQLIGTDKDIQDKSKILYNSQIK